MGRIHFDKLSLAQLVELSPVIVLAREVAGSRVEKTLPLGKNLPPYPWAETGWLVLERLRGPEALSPGAAFTLTSIDPDGLHGHVEYHAIGLDRSPIVAAYEPDPPLPAEPDAARLLFLEHRVLLEQAGRDGLELRADGFAPVCWGAMESEAKRAEVAALAAAHPARCDGLQLTVGTHGNKRAFEDALCDRLPALFPDQPSLSWTTIDLRPKPLA